MPAAPTTVKPIEGLVHAVPCPWCGKPNDLRAIQQQLGQGFEPGCVVDCDHCKRLYKVTRVVPTTIVQVRQHQ